MDKKEIEKQARHLARENRVADPDIQKIYWFPDENEVRLVELHSSIPPSGNEAAPFYFREQPLHNLPAPSGILLIKPEEFRRISLPDSWGTWEDAIELDVA